MKYIMMILCCSAAAVAAIAQPTVYPAPAQHERIALLHATIHIGNGQVIEDGTLVFNNGRIEQVGHTVDLKDAKQIDCSGKQVYPGLILSNSDLGLVEVPSVRATRDVDELGELNPNVRSIVAYNTDSRVINTLRIDGILMANIVPDGSLITGSSSVVQLDAWNWEDAAYAKDNGIHFKMPSLLPRPSRRAGFSRPQQGDPQKAALDKIEEVKTFFRQAKAYLAVKDHDAVNLKFEAVKGLFDGSKKLFIHCNIVKEMLIAVDIAKEFGFKVVIVGGSDSWQIADILRDNNIAVILNQMHDLPNMVDDDIDQPFKTPYLLHKAGVLFAINDEDGSARSRNLAFNAGTAAAYGLGSEAALQAITLDAARILGIDDRTGSLEQGKDANIVVSDGDILDMRGNIIRYAFIQGRQIDLTSKQELLYERYKHKYGLN